MTSIWLCMNLQYSFWLQIHYSKQGQAFKSQAQSMHLEILQSPWLCELMAFHINLRETKPEQRKASALFDGCSLVINEGKASLFCELFDSIKLDIDLTCSVCLVSLLNFHFKFCTQKTEENTWSDEYMEFLFTNVQDNQVPQGILKKYCIDLPGSLVMFLQSMQLLL